MTYLGMSRDDRLVMWIGFPAAGAALGWFVPPLARWAAENSPFLPWEWAVHLAENAQNWLAALVGLVAGAALALAGEHESLAVTVTDQRVQLRVKGATKTYRREQIHVARLDGKQLVLEAAGGVELAREKPESKSEVTEKAFRDHGYPWVETQR
jgi:hypothetical protein